VNITGGTVQITSSDGRQILYTGNISNGKFNNVSGGGLIMHATVNHVFNSTHPCASTGETLTIDTLCSTSNGNSITVSYEGLPMGGFGTFRGAVDCPSQGGGGTTTQQSSSSSSSSSMTGTTTQDRDRDGIPDANDNCPNLPNTRCYREGDTALVVHNSNR
jgi:hypothetical protein